MSGDTPCSLLVHFVLLTGHPALFSAATEALAISLKAFKSAWAFSSDSIRSLHFRQMYPGSPSLVVTVTLSRASILLAHCCWMPVALKMLTALLLVTRLQHSLHVRTPDAMCCMQWPSLQFGAFARGMPALITHTYVCYGAAHTRYAYANASSTKPHLT